MSARGDYPVDSAGEQYQTMCDEIDDLRLRLAWTEQIAQARGEENERMRPVVFAALAWADAEDETITSELQDSTDVLWDAVGAFRDPCGPDCELDSTGIVHRPMCARWEP